MCHTNFLRILIHFVVQFQYGVIGQGCSTEQKNPDFGMMKQLSKYKQKMFISRPCVGKYQDCLSLKSRGTSTASHSNSPLPAVVNLMEIFSNIIHTNWQKCYLCQENAFHIPKLFSMNIFYLLHFTQRALNCWADKFKRCCSYTGNVSYKET